MRTVIRRYGRASSSPVIVLGNQKSGTTAIAELLARYTTRPLSSDRIWAEEFDRLRSGSMRLGSVARRNRRAFTRGIVKEPMLTFLYPEVRHAFPDATLVFIVRDPRSNLRSLLNRVGLPGDLEDVDLDDWPNYPASWRRLLDPDWLSLPGDTYIDVLAERWNLAADTYLEHRDEMTLVSYEDFVTDKHGTIARLADELGLPERADISADVDIQYQPKGNASVHALDFFGPSNLARVEQRCGWRMEAFRYELTPRVDTGAAGAP